jgi:hypothetical protein
MADTPAASSLDAELARLRAAGLTDDEITNILANRRIGATPGAGMPQAPVTGAMSNFSAMWTHARNIIPTAAAQIVLVFDTSAATTARISALLAVVVKVAFVLIFAYVVLLEFSQFRSSTARARVEACQARQNFIFSSRPAARYTPEGKEETERFLRSQGIPPKIQTPEEIEKEKRQFKETEEQDKRFQEMYAQWKKDCGDVAP